MNEHVDRLEAELATLQPRQPSPELKSRIAERLRADKSAGWLWVAKRTTAGVAGGLAVAAGLAACVMMAIALWRAKPAVVVQREPDITQPLVSNALSDSLPSVWAYHRAVSAASDDVDELLEKHARRDLSSTGPSNSLSGFSISIPRMQSFPGDL